jgi:hypothetical protein
MPVYPAQTGMAPSRQEGVFSVTIPVLVPVPWTEKLKGRYNLFAGKLSIFSREVRDGKKG